MKTLALTVVAFGAMSFSGITTPEANARDFGIHISGPGYHVDFGRPHHRHSHYRGRSAYGRYHGSFYGGYPARTWHDTSHWDYHPGEYVRHGNHYHYIPGHYDWHEDGHWDHHHW